MTALALIEVLRDVPDPRSRHGRVHPLPAILALIAQGGDYLFFVKDNQPTLQTDIAAGFGSEPGGGFSAP